MDAFLKKTIKEKPAVLDVNQEEKYSALKTPSCQPDQRKKAVNGTTKPPTVVSLDREKTQKKKVESSANAVLNVTPDCAVWTAATAPTITVTKLPIHPMFLSSAKVTIEKQKLPDPVNETKTKELPKAPKLNGKDILSTACKVDSSAGLSRATNAKEQHLLDCDLALKKITSEHPNSTKCEKAARKHPVVNKNETAQCISKSSNQVDLSSSASTTSKNTNKLQLSSGICTEKEVVEILIPPQKKRANSVISSSDDRSKRELISDEQEHSKSTAAAPDDSRRSKRQASIAESNAQNRRVREELSREVDDDADFIADSGA
jgi:ribosomal protein L12E/L44/L45/RPP1/RPP2